MLKWLLNLLAINAFILLMPLLLIASVFWGSEDEQWLMRIAFWVTFPFTVWMWYLIVRFWRRAHGKA